MLDWFPNADHASLYTAIAHGYFNAVGLDVRPIVPSESAEPLKLLAAGKVDMAISYEPQLLLARDQGLKAGVDRRARAAPAHLDHRAALSAREQGLRPRRQARGHRGIAYQAAELHTALRAAGVNPSSVTESDVGFNLVPAMLSGKVAATLGGYWNYEAIQLRQMHKNPVVIPIDQAGVPTYDELVLVVRAEEARTDGVDMRAFLQALTRGEQQVRANPAAAAALIVKANPSAEEKLQLASIEATLPATLPTDHSKPYGWQEPSAWAAFGHWMFTQGLIHSNPNTAGLPPFTNEFLPGARHIGGLATTATSYI